MLLLTRGVAAQESAAIFEAPVVVVPNQQARMNALLDLDGDGFVDSVGTYWQQSGVLGVFAFRNDGSGRMLPVETQLVSVGTTTTPPSPIAVADFTGDGLEDWAVAVNTEIRGFASNGAAPSNALPVISFPGIGFAQDLTTGDYDGNGTADLALRTLSHIQLYLDFGRPTQSGPITLATMQTGGGASLRTGDLTGDGIDDLFTFRGSSERIDFFQYSAGALQPIATWLVQIDLTDSPYACFGDLDGDADQDIVIFGMSGVYRVLRRTGPASFDLEPFANGGPATDLADVDLDGDLDGVCCGGGGGPSPYLNTLESTFEIAMNNGSGAFAKSFNLQSMGSNRIAGVADVDHDGDVDLVAGRVIYFNRDGIEPDVGFGIAGFPRPQDFFDIDGDGDLDYGAMETSYNANVGDAFVVKLRQNFFTVPLQWYGPGFPTDYDSDGDIDQIFHQVSLGGAVERVLLNNGGGGLSEGGLVTAYGVTFAPTPTPNCVLFVDLDFDGDLDVVCRSALGDDSQSFTNVFLRNAAGVYQSSQGWSGERVQRVADFDGDGIPDLLTLSQTATAATSAIYLRHGVGDGTFVNPIQINPEPIYGPHYITDHEVGTGDWDGDSDIDIVYYFFTTGTQGVAEFVRLLENSGAGTFILRSDAFPNYHAGALPALSGDVDGDGVDDLVLGCTKNSEQSLSIYKGTIGGSYPLEYLGTQALAIDTMTGLLDLDQDGDADLLGFNETRNQVLHGAEAGAFRQFGISTAGAGGHKPTMGAKGPFRVGESAELRVTGTKPNSIGLIFVGTDEVRVKLAMTGGFAYTLPWFLVVTVPYGGNASEIGSGHLAIPYIVPTAVAGSSYIHQAVIFDAAAQGGASVTNAIEIEYGP